MEQNNYTSNQIQLVGRIIDSERALIGTPEPHHLRGLAEYREFPGVHVFSGSVFFDSQKHRSIETRSDKYLENPHVNSGDVQFATWNAAHIIGDVMGYSVRTLVDEIRTKPINPVPPDKELSLTLLLKNFQDKIDSKDRPYTLGSLEAFFFDTSYAVPLPLAEVYSNIFARK